MTLTLTSEVESLRIVDDEADAFAELCELVAQKGPLDLADSDERIEGAAPGLDIRILRRLRAAHYAIEAHLDLHGLAGLHCERALEDLAGIPGADRVHAGRQVGDGECPALRGGSLPLDSRGFIADRNFGAGNN